jgi:hypothetical protein
MPPRPRNRRSGARTVVITALICALFFGSVPANAGTICGTVCDAQTLTPIANAAIFLFDSLDTYTGIYAATDGTAATLEVYDVRGRFIKGWREQVLNDGDNGWVFPARRTDLLSPISERRDA